MNSKITLAVAAVLGGSSFALQAAEPATESAGAKDSLEEIVVTATRRSESMQNVPIAMQAFTAESLSQLNVTTFDDYVKFLPNVTTANNGPGQNELFMRGLSAGAQPSQGSGSTAAYPNVAIYLDNQSGQLPGRNLDIYAADLNRIEVLEGPQGTLFGSGAEAGVIRYITNEPKLDVTEASVKAGYSVTAHGDPNSDLTAVLNLPLIDGKMAVRGVFYNDRRGGYINNVPGTFTRKNTDIGLHYAHYPSTNGVCPDGSPDGGSGYCVPPGSPSLNNYNMTGTAINPVTYQGVRAELLYKFNEDWNVLITQSYQNMDADGVFYQQPFASDGAPLKPLEVTLFNPSHNRDKFESTAWTVNGKFGNLSAVYTGGYLTRKVDQVNDYTNYARGVYADYYQCYGPGTGYDYTLQPTCFSPSAIWRSVERNEHLQNEFRLSTPDDWRLRGIVGVYYQDNKLEDQSDWRYKTVPACTSNATPGTAGNGNTGCFALTGTFPGTTVVNPGIRDQHSSFYQDDVRDTKQTAFFVSFDVDLIPKVLTLTLGTRHFKFDNSFKGGVSTSFGCFEGGVKPTGCHESVHDLPYYGYSYNLDAENLQGSESGFKSRGNLTWHVTPDVMVYYTWSQGFRPGGFNQNGNTLHAYDGNGVRQYVIPKAYLSDKLTNNEIGWKTEFFNHRLQWNGAVYQENWDNVQVAFFDPGVVGNVFYDTNGQDFLIKGIETSFVARLARGLTLQGAASWNRSRQTNSPILLDNNPANPNFGKPIIETCGTYACAPGVLPVPVTNPFGPVGSPTANSPPLQYNLRVRYEWSVNGFTPFVQVSGNFNGHSYTQAGSNPSIAQANGISTGRLRFENPSYSTYDASFGVSKGPWYLNVYSENLSNSNASTFVSSQQFIIAQTPLRPRIIGLTFGCKL